MRETSEGGVVGGVARLSGTLTTLAHVFVAFEGGDGSGKSTQAGLLAGALRAARHHVVETREPGEGPVGEQIRAILLGHAPYELAARTEALLFAADRAQHVVSVVRPALAAGSVVISDRYVDSSIAYQGAGRGLGVQAVEQLSEFATDGLVPGLTVLLDLPEVSGRERAHARGQAPDRIESEPEAMHSQVRQAFLDRAAAAPGRYLVLDGSRPVTSLSAEIVAAVSERLGEAVTG